MPGQPPCSLGIRILRTRTWKSRRTLGFIEQMVLEQRRKGINRYEIYAIISTAKKDDDRIPLSHKV